MIHACIHERNSSLRENTNNKTLLSIIVRAGKVFLEVICARRCAVQGALCADEHEFERLLRCGSGHGRTLPEEVLKGTGSELMRKGLVKRIIAAGPQNKDFAPSQKLCPGRSASRKSEGCARSRYDLSNGAVQHLGRRHGADPECQEYTVNFHA